MERGMILSRLLAKYEKSKHLLEPGVSNRRVMLRVDKKELPEYQFEHAPVRDAFNQAALTLEQDGLISIEWLKGRPVMSAIVLNLASVERCYQAAGRVHPRRQAETVSQMVQSALGKAETPWIAAWRDSVCENARNTYTVPAYCKTEVSFLSKLLCALAQYDALRGEPVTMRAFSSVCYHDSKTFEREIRERFLHIAEKYHPDLAEVCERETLSARDKLAFLGIYARPELYEFSGNCVLTTQQGTVNAGALYPYGIALPSTAVDAVTGVDLSGIRKIMFIENKTNYDEYLLSELDPATLAVYHGGFLSPQKRKLFAKFAQAIPEGAQRFFWADIDLGGFQMFAHLSGLIPDLQPIHMSGEDVGAHWKNGLERPEEYLDRLRQALQDGTYPLFEGAIREILKHGVTIEQETFLAQK